MHAALRLLWVVTCRPEPLSPFLFVGTIPAHCPIAACVPIADGCLLSPQCPFSTHYCPIAGCCPLPSCCPLPTHCPLPFFCAVGTSAHGGPHCVGARCSQPSCGATHAGVPPRGCVVFSQQPTASGTVDCAPVGITPMATTNDGSTGDAYTGIGAGA